MTWDDFKKQALEKGWQFASDFFANLATHWLFTNKIENNQVVMGPNGKPEKVLNVEAIREHAPYLVQSLADEAEFNGLITKLDVGLRKNLEIQMGPIVYGPHRAGEIPPGIGKNQRSDIILTIVNMNGRQGVPHPREETVKRLEILAAIGNPADWKRQAVAFKLMKANEGDYLVTTLTAQVQLAFASLVGEFLAAKREWDDWVTQTTNGVIRPYTNTMRTYLRTRPRGFFATLRRMFDLPWETDAPAVDAPAPHGGAYDPDYRPFGRRLR